MKRPSATSGISSCSRIRTYAARTHKGGAEEMRKGAFAAALLIASVAFAQTTQNHPYISADQSNAIANEWTKPMEPFKILGNLYYVGSQNIGSYLFVTPQGDILLDTGMPSMHQAVKGNIEKLGFKLSDIKVMISSHAHIDHVGGH